MLRLLTSRREQAREHVARLTADLDEVMAASAGSNADDEHDPEGATVGFERAQLSALLEAARGRLDDVERALQQAREGGYGSCGACGRQIGAERLAARPATRLCLGCAASSTRRR